MIIVKKDCNLWEEVYNENNDSPDAYDAVVCNTSKTVRGNGMLVMSSKQEQEFNDRFPGLSETWGHRFQNQLNTYGVMVNPTFIKRKNNPAELEGNVDLLFIAAFPTRKEYKNTPDMKTIETSAVTLKKLADTMGWDKILMSAPEGISWEEEVKPVFDKLFDTRFTVIINE